MLIAFTLHKFVYFTSLEHVKRDDARLLQIEHLYPFVTPANYTTNDTYCDNCSAIFQQIKDLYRTLEKQGSSICADISELVGSVGIIRS